MIDVTKCLGCRKGVSLFCTVDGDYLRIERQRTVHIMSVGDRTETVTEVYKAKYWAYSVITPKMNTLYRETSLKPIR